MKQAVALGSGELEKELNQAAKEAPARRAAQGLAPYPEQTNQFNPNSAASMEAAIWDGTDGKARDEMYAGMDTLYDDPTSPYYNQYRKPTNTQYTDPLKKYGLEVPDIITADWINEQWSQYGKYLPTNAAGTSASLPKKHTKEQEIAFSLYQLNAIEYTTQKAEKELADIRDKVTWYAQHGYSQDYIAKVIGSEKHSTLDSLNITRDPNAISQFDEDGYNISTKQGTAVQLNRSVYFDNDILTGMYWKALNGADDVDDFTAAVYAYQNKGRLTGGSKRLDDMRTYGNPNYNPHNDGCTNIDAKMAFGQDDFTYEDLKRLRAETDPFDTTKQKLLDKLFDNETRTANAEKELAWLNGRVSGFNYNVDIPEGKDPRKYFEERVDSWLANGGSDAGGLTNLKTMDKRREEGNPMDINRSINYRKEDVVDAMMARYNAAHGITTDPRAELAPKQPETSQSKTAGLDIPEPPVKPAEEGNIDIDNRQVVQNEDGTFSTEESFSTNIDGMEVLLPTIINGKRVSEDEAIAHYMETGENLGKFRTVEDAEAYAEWLHNRQEKVYGEQAEPEQTEPEQVEQPPKKDDSVYNVQVGGHYVQVPAYDKDGNRMTEEEAMQAYIDSRNGGSSDSRTAPAEPAPQTDTFRTYERRDDKEMQDWVDSHTTDSFDPNFVMKVPSSRGNWAGTVAAGGAVSDQPTWYKGKNDTRPQEVYVVTDKEGAQEFTSADLLHIMNAAYSGKGDQLSEEERRMGEGLINSIPWAFGDSLQWLGTNGEFDSGAMKRMDDTARALGEDLRNIRDAASSYYATSGEKADIAVRFFEDALSAANAGKTIAEWYDQTEEGQQRKQELLDEAVGINQRADDIKAENDEKERQAKREALAVNLTIMQASPDQLDENGKAAADQMTLRPGEADSILAMPEAKDTWDKEGRAFVDYVGANFSTPYQEALNNDDLAAAQDIVCRFMGFPKGTNVDGISEDMFNAEQLGIIEVAKQLYAQDAKIAMASGMTLEEYYETVGHRNAEDLMHASFEYRQLMNGEDSISEEAKQGIGVLATVGNGMKLGAIDVASGDVGFVADIANILTSPGDFKSLSTRYTNRYGFFQGRSQYRNDVDTMLAWWESQDDEASQQKAAEYREKMKLIDANGLDIFNLGFNPDTDLLERVRKQVNDELEAMQDWIDKYATDAEKHGVQIIRSATGSTIQQTRAMALSAVTGIPTGLATTMSFLPGSFEGHMQDTEGRGWSDTRRYMYAMIGGLMDAALEGEFSSKYYNVGGDALSGFLKDGATKFAATHGITGLGSHLVYGLMVYAGNSVGEITQEVLQNVAGGIYDYLWTGNDEMLRDSVARDTMVDTILSTALSTFMSTTAHQAGQAANGAPSIFSNRYRITTAAMLEFSPELREAAHELFSAGSIYNRGDDVLDLVTEGSRQSAMTRAGEIGEVMPDRSMPEPTQANELNSARSVTEEEQTAPEQGPQIPAEAPAAEPQTEQPAVPVEEAPVEAPAEAPTAEPQTEQPEAPVAEQSATPAEEAPVEAPVAEPQTEQVEQPAAPVEEAPASNLSPEMQLFVEKAGAWFRDAKTHLADLMNQAADQNITEEQKATLDHQIQTIQSRIADASFEIMDRLTKMDIHLKTAELMRNPEAVAQMVKFTASQRVASKIAAGALTAKPSTKEKLSTKLETAKAADAANKAAETANANAQQAGADLAAARDVNRENPTPENAKREVNAAKKKVDADRQAEQARKEADDANTAAQKAEEDLNSELQSNLEAIRQEATDDATAEVQQLQQTVGDSLETALDEDSVTKVDLPVIERTPGPVPTLPSYLYTRDQAEAIVAFMLGETYAPGKELFNDDTPLALRTFGEVYRAADKWLSGYSGDVLATQDTVSRLEEELADLKEQHPDHEFFDDYEKYIGGKKAELAEREAEFKKARADLVGALMFGEDAVRKLISPESAEAESSVESSDTSAPVESAGTEVTTEPTTPVTEAQATQASENTVKPESTATVNQPEAQTPVKLQTEGPSPALQERLNTLKSRLQTLNKNGKSLLNGNRYLPQAIVDAAAADANVENYLTGLDDAGIQNLLRQSKAAGITKGKAAAWLRGLVREDAAAKGITIEADAYTEAKDNLNAAKIAASQIKAGSAAQLVNSARTVQTVLAEQVRQLEALASEQTSRQQAGQGSQDISERLRALRQDMTATMDAAGIVLRAYGKDTSHSGFVDGTYENTVKQLDAWRTRVDEDIANMQAKSAEEYKANIRNGEASFDADAHTLLQDITGLVNAGSKVVPTRADGFHDYRLSRVGNTRRNAPTGAQQPGAFNPPSRSPIEIFQKLGNDLGIGTYTSVHTMPAGHENAPATTNERRGYILAARYHSNDAWVLYHEIGHNIQERTHMATTQDMINAMSEDERTEAGEDLNNEAFAEFVASYVSGTASSYYSPDTIATFENNLRTSGIYRQVQEARLAQAAYNNASGIERIAAHVKYENHRDERPTATGRAIRDAMRKAGIGFVDDTMAAARFDSASGLARDNSRLSIQEQAKLMKGDAQRATQLIVGQLRDMSGRLIREDGFADATEGFSMEQIHLLDTYTTALHAYDRATLALQNALAEANNGREDMASWRALTAEEERAALEEVMVLNPEYHSLEQIERAITDVQTNHPEVAAAADQRSSWWKDFMQVYGVNTHLITQEQFDAMNRDYPHYAPLYRIGKNGGDIFRQLTGSDRDVVAPTEGYVHNINRIIERGRRNAVLESIYNELLSETDGDGLGLFARVADGAESQEGSNMISFTDERGERHYIQFEDKELFDMIANSASPEQAHGFTKGVGKLTKAMAMFTTGSNPLFAAKNFVRDFQQGVNHGSWAATYLTGAVKWLAAGIELAGSQLADTRLAERLHLSNALNRLDRSGHAAEYRALNGSDEYSHHGLPRSTKDADNLLAMFTDDVKSRPKQLADTAWKLVTFDAVNGWVEQTTRFAEYLFGKHDLNTDVGRQKAYLAAQESTTNFALSGNSQWAADLRNIIPFFNATLQGTYSAFHGFSEAERDRLPARLAKTAVNNILTGALAYGLLDKFGSDDDKKWYEKLAEGLKMDSIILPFTPFDKLAGNEGAEHPRQFIRIPLTQNLFGKLFYNVGRIMLHDKIGGEALMNLGGVVQSVLGDALQTDTVWSPLINVYLNKTYYGSNIVPNYLLKTYDGKTLPNVAHTNESTANLFNIVARFFDSLPYGLGRTGITDDPMRLQYLTQQYSGFLGKLVIPFLTGSRATGYNTGAAEVAYNLMNIMRGDWTIDAAYSNDINDAFHNYSEAISSIVGSADRYGQAYGVNQMLSQEEQQEAVDVGRFLQGPTGPLTVLGEEISDLYNKQSKVYADETLSYDERQIQGRDLSKRIVEKQEEGLGICKEYASKYMGQSFCTDYILYGPTEGVEKNPTASFPRVLDATKDGKHPGMQRALEVYKRADGDPNMTASSYNPSPYAAVQLTKSTKVPLYAMPTACAEQYQDTFVESIETSLGGVDWDSMTPGEQETVVKKAVSTAKTAARKAVLSYYDLNGLMPTD